MEKYKIITICHIRLGYKSIEKIYIGDLYEYIVPRVRLERRISAVTAEFLCGHSGKSMRV